MADPEKPGAFHGGLFQCVGWPERWAVRRTDGSWTVARAVTARPARTFARAGVPVDMVYTFDVGDSHVKDVFVAEGVLVQMLGLATFVERFGPPPE